MVLPNSQAYILLLILVAFIPRSYQSAIDKPTENVEKAEEPKDVRDESSEPSAPDEEPQFSSPMRQGRMMNFWDYYNAPPYYPMPQPAFIPYPYYSGFEQYDDFADDNYGMDIASRANIVRRRPGSSKRPQYQDSPIFYIRLPPTPYMFVPGAGYISQPPTFNPMIPMPPVNPPMPAMPPPMPPVASMPVSPFISIPLNFVSNARPTSIYHFGSSLQPPYSVPQAPSLASQFGLPAMPSYQPMRPHRPRPRPTVADSEVTQLKGQFLFNGRPNQIYLLTNNSPSPMYTGRMNPYY